jgi:hypothetical protein
MIRFAAALSVVLFSTAAFADSLVERFPTGCMGIWFGESMQSARKKCDKFSDGADYKVCMIGERAAQLYFTRGKMTAFKFDISQADYSDSVNAIVARVGVKARHEDKNGNEYWSVKLDGKPAGSVVLQAAEEGHAPFVYFQVDAKAGS